MPLYGWMGTAENLHEARKAALHGLAVAPNAEAARLRGLGELLKRCPLVNEAGDGWSLHSVEVLEARDSMVTEAFNTLPTRRTTITQWLLATITGHGLRAERLIALLERADEETQRQAMAIIRGLSDAVAREKAKLRRGGW